MQCDQLVLIYLNNSLNSQEETLLFLDLSLTPLKTKISKHERLRLIANINNQDVQYSDYIFEYTELNGYLTELDINSNRAQMFDDSYNYNLILERDALEAGLEYNFNLNVYNKLFPTKVIASANTLIKVFDQDEYLIDGSFVIEPSCKNLILNNISQILEYTFDLSINTYNDFGNNTIDHLQYQISLQFANNDTDLLLHSGLLSNPYLNDVILPLGTYWIKITTIAIDTGVTTTKMVHQCNITVNTTATNDQNSMSIAEATQVVSYTQLSNRLFAASYYVYLLQYVQAIVVFYGENMDKFNVTNEDSLSILSLLMDTFGSENANLCHTSYVTHLAQIVTLWIEYFGDYNYDTNIITDEYLYNLLQQILDPCQLYASLNTISGNRPFEQSITVDVESIITQNGKIFDNSGNLDVSGDISNILTSTLFNSQLYDLMEFGIKYFDNNNYNNNRNNSYAFLFK